ncbi:hypothetical protein JHW43_000539 [Diplocarpon mali]|nr:hypothetical protein JHW43_000539 [Diplocarpon mali]
MPLARPVGKSGVAAHRDGAPVHVRKQDQQRGRSNARRTIRALRLQSYPLRPGRPAVLCSVISCSLVDLYRRGKRRYAGGRAALSARRLVRALRAAEAPSHGDCAVSPPGGLACVAVEPGIGSGVLLLRGLESRGPVAGSPIRRLGGLDDLGGRGGAQIRLDGRAGVEVSSQVSGVGCAATDDVAAARPSGARPSMRPGLPTGRRTDRCASRGCQPISRAGMGGHSCGEREARTTTTAAPTTTTRPPSPPNAVPSDPTPADPQQESPFTAALRSPFPPDHIQISFCASDCAQIPDPCRRSPPRCRPSTTEQKHGADADARGGRDGTGSWLTARPGKIGCRGGSKRNKPPPPHLQSHDPLALRAPCTAHGRPALLSGGARAGAASRRRAAPATGEWAGLRDGSRGADPARLVRAARETGAAASHPTPGPAPPRRIPGTDAIGPPPPRPALGPGPPLAGSACSGRWRSATTAEADAAREGCPLPLSPFPWILQTARSALCSAARLLGCREAPPWSWRETLGERWVGPANGDGGGERGCAASGWAGT